MEGRVDGEPNVMRYSLADAEQFTQLNLQDSKIGWMGDFEK